MYEIEVDGKKVKINYIIWSDVFVCLFCGNEIVLWDEVVDLDKEIMKDFFLCLYCGNICFKKNMEKVWEILFDLLLNKIVILNKKVLVRVNYILFGKRGEKNIDVKDKNFIENMNLYKLNFNLYINKFLFGEKIKVIKSFNYIEYLYYFFYLCNFILNNRVLDLLGKDIYF